MKRVLGSAVPALIAFAVLQMPDAQADPPPATSTQENDCSEVAIPRAAATTGLQALVPPRYGVSRLGPVASRSTVTTYTCRDVSVDGRPSIGVGAGRTTTVSIGWASVSSRDGAPVSGGYLLWWASDNPELTAAMRQAGLPATFLPSTTTALESDAGTTHLTWDIRGDGLDYDVDARATEPSGAATDSSLTLYYDGPSGDVDLTFTNHAATSTALVTADLSANQVLAPILVASATPTGVAFPYFRGDWSSQVSSLDH